jgi:hypothetical protein
MATPHLFNQRDNGIFMDDYVDRDGLPVGDVFAYLFRASLFGTYGKDWTKERLASLIRCYSSDQLAELSDDASVAKWGFALSPFLPDDISIRRIYAEALLVPELQPDQVMSVCWDRDSESGFMVRRTVGEGDWCVAEEWRNGDIAESRGFEGAGALALAYGWVLTEREEHLYWRDTEQGTLMVEYAGTVPALAPGDDSRHAVVTASNCTDTAFLDDLAHATKARIVNRLTIVAGAEAGWALPYPRRDVVFLDRTREFWEPPSKEAILAASRVRPSMSISRCRTEFPELGNLGFEPADIGFPVDTSWHNDAMASFETEDGLYRLWVAEEGVANREFPEEARFSIQRNNTDGMVSDDAPLFNGEHAEDLLAYAEKANFKALQERGRNLAAPRG